MTTAADITALQAATTQAVKDLNTLAQAQTDLAAAKAALAPLQAQVAALTADGVATHTALDAANARIVGLQADNTLYAQQIKAMQATNTSLAADLAQVNAKLGPSLADAARWQKARMPDPTTYDKFFKDGGITSVALTAAEADAAMDLAIAGKTPAGTFLGMYSMSVVKP